jgi:hypothetical protein
MTRNAEDGGEGRRAHWRIAIWGTAAFLLLLPFIAMQFTDEVNWDETDFAVFGAMLILACGTYELAARMTCNRAYRAAAGVAIGAAFVLVWMNLAVGIIGDEDNPANLMYGGVLALGLARGIIARFRPNGMAVALVATALAQAMVAAIALIAGLGSSGPSWPWNILVLTGFFVALWLLSAWLFRIAAQEETPTSAAP